MKIHIKGGRVVDPKNGIDTIQDVFIAAGKIVATGNAPEGFHANRVVEATGLVVSPGLVDLSARLREPGFEYKATLSSEMAAAVAGGVTSLVCPPDTDPPLDEPGLVQMLKHRAKGLNQARVFPLGALTQKLAGTQLTEMAELHDAGCIAFSHGDVALNDTLVMMRAMEYAATFGYTVWLRPQDALLSKIGVAHDGEVATRLGLPSIPSCAETIALSTILLLAKQTGAKVHICRLSSSEAIDMVRTAKKQGMDISCDIGVHHAHLSEMDIGFFDSNCRLIPPLRSLRDKDAIRNGLKDGTIDVVCSDHTPVDDDAKILPFAEAEPGATGLELLLPLTLKWATEMKIPLVQALAKVTVEPAKVLGIDNGHLGVGQAADICIFDPEVYWKIEPKALKSQGKNTPFLGMELQGKVRYTLVEGHVVYESTH
ncbi:dihydroorotase [Sulfurirhabdus autotrophica]|uniref:Dihydroorotase n=1 Tax=Sulfurirhabdus autotrophica TaxID=1706046 RepID=A0A4V2W220_9PROT|nr:dihydroorotase [Sulfurirhabdus autotrophica]TCV86359.1 dihydroorotase [Sulfurirhabdus autotrophica]